MTILAKVISILALGSNRAAFFNIIESLFPRSSWQFIMIEKAYNDAKDAFRGTLRDDKKRYFEHLRASTLILILHFGVEDPYMIAAMLLHDILEDKKFWPRERILAEYNATVLLYLEYVSLPRIPGYTKEELLHIYHERLEKLGDDMRKVIMIKASDRLHNMIEIYECKPEKVRRKIAETERVYLPLCKKHCVGWHELLEAVAEAKRHLSEKEAAAKIRRKVARLPATETKKSAQDVSRQGTHDQDKNRPRRRRSKTLVKLPGS